MLRLIVIHVALVLGAVLTTARNEGLSRSLVRPSGTSLSLDRSSDTRWDNSVDTGGFINDSPCPVAFHYIGGRCYFYGYFKLNWFRAMEFCHSFGQSVSLACIETPEENQALKTWLTRNGDHSTGVWVGGSENGHEGKWAWFPTGQLIRNFNWGPSQPSGGDQHCMYIVGGFLGYQWADFHCAFKMTFLCEYQVNSQMAWRRRRILKENEPIGPDTELDFIRDLNETRIYMQDLHQRIETFQQAEDEEDEKTEQKLAHTYTTAPTQETIPAMDEDLEQETKPQPTKSTVSLLTATNTFAGGSNLLYTPPKKHTTSNNHITRLQNSIVISKKASSYGNPTTPAPLFTPNHVGDNGEQSDDEDITDSKRKEHWSIFNLIKRNIARLG